MATEEMKDYGPVPMIINIEQATLANRDFRRVVWTGKHLQLTLMSINPGDDIGVEMHPDVDQFIRIEQGEGLAKMGDRQDNLYFQQKIGPSDAVVVAAGTWHNIVNTGRVPLKVYSIYAPPQHPWGTIHTTRAEAMAAETEH